MSTGSESENSPERPSNNRLSGLTSRKSSSSSSVTLKSSKASWHKRRKMSAGSTNKESSHRNKRTNQRAQNNTKLSPRGSTDVVTEGSDDTSDDDNDANDEDDDDVYDDDDNIDDEENWNSYTADLPVECTGHDHLETPVIDELIPFAVDTLYEMIFGNHNFYKHFQGVNDTTDLVLSEWSEPDDLGDRRRTITYTVAINYNVGPKSASTTEKQFTRHCSRPGFCYVIDAEAHTTGVPYGDNFYLINRFCMTKTGRKTTRLRITSSIKYVKKVWGLVKGFIEKNVRHGTLRSYTLLGKLLTEEAEKQQVERNPVIKQHKVKHSKKLQESTHHSTERGEINNNVQCTPKRDHARAGTRDKTKTESLTNDNELTMQTNRLAKFLFFLLVFLVLINMALYYKLDIVQGEANILEKARINFGNRARADVDLAADWQTSFNSQEKQHEADLDKWKDVLSGSAKVMDTIHNTLMELQAQIIHHQDIMKERYKTQDTNIAS